MQVGKSVLGCRNGKCKGPEFGASLDPRKENKLLLVVRRKVGDIGQG